MGMAASQARYLALVARKSNCEYEGQQINQSRLNLSNKSANLFNEMLGLNVPIPPSKQDYMKLQYTYQDSGTEHTITAWHQLASPDSDGYNYIVDTEYTTKIYTGSQKKRTNPQVQFSGAGPNEGTSCSQQITMIQDALKTITACQETYKKDADDYNTYLSQAKNLTFYRDASYNGLTSSSVTEYESGDQKGYTITRNIVINNDGYQVFTYTPESSTTSEKRYYKDGLYYKYADDSYTEVTDEDSSQYVADSESRNYISYETLGTLQTTVKDAVDTLIENGALEKGYSYENMYYDSTSGTMVFLSDIESVGSGVSSILFTYYPDHETGDEDPVNGIKQVKEELDKKKSKMESSKSLLDIAKAAYDALDVPTYVGNYELTPLSELTDAQVTAITQIIKDMKENDIETNLTKCFKTVSGDYSAETYSGGIFSYEQAGVTFYTTYYDLANSFINGSGINNIDNQSKLPVYSVGDVDTTIKSSEKALLETDPNGRFTSVRFENDSMVYNLTVKEIEDSIAYEDAMNQYDYKKALYDKKVSDINAQTELIQREDQDLELRLKQLDTEQNALSTEIDAVSKVVKDNIEKSFKTFGG